MVFAVQLPVAASAKSRPVAPCVSTAIEPNSPALTKVKANGITELVLPIFTAPKFQGDGGIISALLTVKAIEVVAESAPDVPVIFTV